MLLSVIIPCLNEAENLPPTLERISSFRPGHEVIVVDAGSSDNSVEVAKGRGALVINSPVRQRAAQLNLGARHAKGEIFLFLHADTILPQRAFERVIEALEKPKVVGGAFRRYFLSDSMFLQMTCRLAMLRSHVLGWHLGDQAMFVSASVFHQLGGFQDMDRFEDFDFSRRLGRVGKVVTIPTPVLTSGRRFDQRGPLRTTLRDAWWTVKFLCGDKKVTQRSLSQ